MEKKENKIRYYLKKCVSFFKKDIWNIDSSSIPLYQKIPINIYRTLALAAKDFVKDKCALWASTLTYNVALSFVPMMAVIFSVAKVFRLYDSITPVLLATIEKYAPMYEPFIRQIFSFAENVNLANYGIIGLGATVVSMVFLLMNVQKCLTSIWNVKYTASLPRQVADYTALLILLPILIGITLTLIAYSSISVHFMPYVLRLMLSTIAPIAILWFIILLLYVLIPATKVLWRGAALSSLLASVAIIIILNVYIRFNIGVEKYENIFDNQINNVEYKISYIDNIGIKNYEEYGTNSSTRPLMMMTRSLFVRDTNSIKKSFKEVQTSSLSFSKFNPVALEQIEKYNFKTNDTVLVTYSRETLASILPKTISITSAFVQIPVLLLLIYLFWAIVLFGAEMNNAYQLFTLYNKDISDFEMSYREKELIAISMLTDIAKSFIKKEKLPSTSSLAIKYKIPLEHVASILQCFEKAGYILSFTNKRRMTTYSLGMPPEAMRVEEVIDIVKNYGESGRALTVVSDYYVEIFKRIENCDIDDKLKRMTIKDAVEGK